MIDKFIIQKHLQINPLSQDFKNYWRQEKRRCIEGVWVDNVYVPGTLYFFANYWKIKLQRKGGGEYIGRPFIRDIEWEKALIYLEAKGFSGFELETRYSCDRKYLELMKKYPDYLKIPKDKINTIKQELFEEGINILELDFTKEYINARDYLKRQHTKPLGKPLFVNQAKNIIECGSRGYGKSYWASAIIGGNLLFDGSVNYDELLTRVNENNPLTSETVVGAIDSKYSSDLLSKVKLGLDELPGGIVINNKVYPSPLSKSFIGSFTVNRFIETVRKVKVDGNWIVEGSRTKIHHRSFADNPFAANGTRPNLICLEEIGFFTNLLDAYGNLTDCTTVEGKKFGIIWSFGTGGSMSNGATYAAQKIFYNPDKYDCLVFENTFENNGFDKIGYFMPAHRKLNEFRVNGILNVPAAKKHIEILRTKAKEKSQKEYNNVLENNPEKPSEAFLVLEGNRFPVAELKDCLGNLLGNETLLDSAYKTEFKMDETGVPLREFSNKIVIRDFPYENKNGTDTAIEIYELPIIDKTTGRAVQGRYIAGYDPTEDDGKVDGDHSLQSCFILDIFTDRIVAEYTGRTYMTKDYYEQLRRLLMYYNAVCNYENNKKGPYQYFDTKKSLHLLADTPTSLAEKQLQHIRKVGNESKGTTATLPVINWGLDLLLEWLEEEVGGIRNMHKIKNPALLNELIMYNGKINADRISALVQLMILRHDKVKIYEASKSNKDIAADDDIWTNHFTKNIKKRNYEFEAYNSLF